MSRLEGSRTEAGSVDTSKLGKYTCFAGQREDLVGPYLSPLEHVRTLSLDEKREIEVLDRTQPGFPAKKGRGQISTNVY